MQAAFLHTVWLHLIVAFVLIIAVSRLLGNRRLATPKATSLCMLSFAYRQTGGLSISGRVKAAAAMRSASTGAAHLVVPAMATPCSAVLRGKSLGSEFRLYCNVPLLRINDSDPIDFWTTARQEPNWVGSPAPSKKPSARPLPFTGSIAAAVEPGHSLRPATPNSIPRDRMNPTPASLRRLAR